ncbi:hypothetical protein BAAM1489_05745 [Bifidobacterium animalis subsp. animalis MCC 1489]|nr:hypothetical protein BANAN_00165 [Bifidobacterium animalis subsp. animalis ATCC 25527]KFI39585.1 hypothetical protein BASA_1580 [Bifidobacterium animalis subsp. animalis]KOA63446.1 hypothetical protein BAAM1489_05745 [Bifidobacterium animalis subsp. animalis MCC 1489]
MIDQLVFLELEYDIRRLVINLLVYLMVIEIKMMSVM